jgi:hypothetical protein
MAMNQGSSQLSFGLDRPLPAAAILGDGRALNLSGWCAHASQRIMSLEVGVGAHWEAVRQWGVRRIDLAPRAGSLGRGFYAVALPPVLLGPGRVEVALRAQLEDGSSAEVALGSLRAAVPAELKPSRGRGNAAQVAICMAVFEPMPALFKRQVASIRAQTHGRWTCYVQDDASRPAHRALIRRVLGSDRRFKLLHNRRNLGFYENFEACLRRVPPAPDCAYVALADQDDDWRPHKLAALIAALERGPMNQLAYSDMRVTGAQRQVMHQSYYTYRRNSYGHVGDLLLANTVAGAASLFRRELLQQALPFPRAVDAGYHDHWIACAAQAAGDLVFVDEPLYDYVQHGRNIIGHTPFQPQRPRWRGDLALLRDLIKPGAWTVNFRWAERRMEESVLKTAGWARILLGRFPHASADKRAQLERVAAIDRSMVAAFAQLLGGRLRRVDDLGMARAALRCQLFLGLGRATAGFGLRNSEKQFLYGEA